MLSYRKVKENAFGSFVGMIVREGHSTSEVFLVAFLVFTVLLMVLPVIWQVIKHYNLITSQRDRRLDPFARDISTFLMLGLERENQITNLHHHVNQMASDHTHQAVN